MGIPAARSAAGHQGYIVYPVIEESKLELKAASRNSNASQNRFFPNLKLGCSWTFIQRRKEAVMQSFVRTNAILVLYRHRSRCRRPNATVMVIEHAERFAFSIASIARTHRTRCTEIALRLVVLSSYGRCARAWKPCSNPKRFEIAEPIAIARPANFSALASPAKWVFTSQPLRDREFLETAATKPSH